MWLTCFSPSSAPTFSFQPFQTVLTLTYNRHRRQKNSGPPPPPRCRLEVGFEDVAAITQNKVLLAAAVSAAVGQLSKPFTSSFLYGNDFDLKGAFQSGGFPSTHSSAVVATATSLGLERGFSDAIFGLTVVYATLVVYDAQGVRREVGKHARTINSMLLESRRNLENRKAGDGGTTVLESIDPLSSSGAQSTNLRQVTKVDHFSSGSDLLGKMGQENNTKVSTSFAGQVVERNGSKENNLYERVGHTEVEVVAGALLGAFVSLTLYSLA